MSGFRFKLQALQQYREHQRDLCRQMLAQVLAEDAALVRQKGDTIAARDNVLEQMRELQIQDRMDVDQAAARRFHAAQLLAQVRQIDVQREHLAERLVRCRQALTKADQGVKVLEQLADKQRREYEQILESKESREREEVWQAGKMSVEWK